MDNISKAASVIGIKEIDDEIFDEIENSPMIKRLKVYVMQCCVYCALFGCLFLTFGLVAIIGYENKSHLGYLALISTLHIIGFAIGWIGIMKKIRYSMVAMAITNIAWITFVSLLIVVFLFFLEKKELKEEFNDEIIFHIGLLVYYPLAVVYAICHLFLVYTLYTSKLGRELSVDEERTDTSVRSESTKSESKTKQSTSSKNLKRKSSDSLKTKQKKFKPSNRPGK